MSVLMVAAGLGVASPPSSAEVVPASAEVSPASARVSPASAAIPTATTAVPHNLVLFVADGLRSQIVDSASAPAMATLRAQGVDFRNSHSEFPTFTTANASALATGHALGDTGDFGNVLYVGFRVTAANGSVMPFIENDPVLREINRYFADNYLDDAPIVAAARQHGFGTAAIGKLGPVAIFDLAALGSEDTLVLDDASGTPGGAPLSAEWRAALEREGIKSTPPARGDNGKGGSATVAGTWLPNLAQQQYFTEVAVKAVLPHFKASGRPFVLVFWSRDPDGTQHNQGDSPGRLDPGINGPTSLSAVRNADTALAAIEQALDALDLTATTNLVVVADHGFSTVSKQSHTSMAATGRYAVARPGELPVGFLAIDLLQALSRRAPRWKLFDPDDGYREIDWSAGSTPKYGNGLIGPDPGHPRVVVAANGGSDLVYLPDRPPVTNPPGAGAVDPTGSAVPHGVTARAASRETRALARQIVAALLQQDYVSGIFADEGRFGRLPGVLPTGAIGVGGGSAITPHPDLIVNFTSTPIPGCRRLPSLCAAEVADTSLQQGQGMHGSASRADTWNFMAARGPDFRDSFVDPLPASNADIGATVAHLLGLELPGKGSLPGRVLLEALRSTGPAPPETSVAHRTLASTAAANGLRTIARIQVLGTRTYLDAAGFSGRTVGLDGE